MAFGHGPFFMARRATNRFQDQPLQFPVEGIDLRRAVGLQRRGTTIDAENVRCFDPGADRARGGSRGGMEYVFDGRVVTEDDDGDPVTQVFPVQHITSIASATSVVPSLEFGHSIYALTASNGFGQAGSDGVSDWTAGAVTDFAFACSCWDDDNNVYVATVNVTTGAVNVYKLNIASGTPVWTNSALTVATGSLRFLSGMVVVGERLYVARKLSSTSCRISKLNTETGATTSESWKTNTDLPHMIFADDSVQCLAKIGNKIGMPVMGSAAATNCHFIVINTDTDVATTKGMGDAKASTRSCCVSDGVNFFYAICNTTTNRLRKVNTGAVQQWEADFAPNGICYDKSNAFLFGVYATTTSVKRHSLVDGAVISSDDPESVTDFDWIDTDGNGLYTLYVDGAGSNDTLGIEDDYSTSWGPTTRANTTHSGAAMNKGTFQAPTITGVRTIHRMVIADGTLHLFDEDGPTFVTGGRVWDSFSPIFSSQNGERMFFVDGSTYKYYDGATGTVQDWSTDLTAGSLPVDSDNSPARSITTWNGRTVLAIKQNFYMSKQFDPFDWDYSPTVPSAIMAFAGNADLAGFVGSLITTLIPYTDDILMFGCDHEIWRMSGDPGAGGGLDLMSHGIGMAFGRSWAFDPEGLFYFMGSDGRIYKMVPGSPPIPASEAIDAIFKMSNLSASVVTMEWDQDRVGLAVWITPLDTAVKGQAFFWEKRVNAWWQDTYETAGLYPWATHTFDGDAPGDRQIYLGGRDGRVRKFSNTATTDAGKPIRSRVIVGPIKSAQFDELFLANLFAVLTETSVSVGYKIYVGRTAETALASTPVATGTFGPGRNPVHYIQRAGHAIYVELHSTDRWALEWLVSRFMATGMTRRWM